MLYEQPLIAVKTFILFLLVVSWFFFIWLLIQAGFSYFLKRSFGLGILYKAFKKDRCSTLITQSYLILFIDLLQNYICSHRT